MEDTIPRHVAEALIPELGGIGAVAVRLGMSQRVARSLLLSERPLPPWVHKALTSVDQVSDPDPMEVFLAKQDLDHMIAFADAHGLIAGYDHHGDGLVVRLENSLLLLDHQRAHSYLAGIVRAYATGTGECPAAKSRITPTPRRAPTSSGSTLQD